MNSDLRHLTAYFLVDRQMPKAERIRLAAFDDLLDCSFMLQPGSQRHPFYAMQWSKKIQRSAGNVCVKKQTLHYFQFFNSIGLIPWFPFRPRSASG